MTVCMNICLAKAFNRVMSGGFLLSMFLCGGFVLEAYADVPVNSTHTNYQNTIAPGADEIFDVQVDSNGDPVVFTNMEESTLRVPSTHDVAPSYGVRISGNGSSFINNGAIQHDGAGNGSSNPASGIFTDVDNAIIENNGTINTTGKSGAGIYTSGTSTHRLSSINIHQSGGITTSGRGGYGIGISRVYNSTINVSGDINTQGDFGYGITTEHSENSVVNVSGDINTQGDFGYGITTEHSENNIINISGSITTSGAGGIGLDNWLLDNSCISISGYITTSGENGHGVYNNRSDNSSINVSRSGSITTSGENGHGIYIGYSRDNSVFNSGTITVKDSTASILYITGEVYTGLNFESSGTLALGSSGGGNDATSLVNDDRYYTGYKNRFKNTGTITRVTSTTPTMDMHEASVLMLHGSNSVPPVAVTLTGDNNMYVEDMANPLPSGSSVTFESENIGDAHMLVIMHQILRLTVLRYQAASLAMLLRRTQQA